MSRLRALADALASDRLSYKQLADGSGVVIDTERMRVLSLNVTGMFALEQIAAGAVDEASLCESMTESFEVDEQTAARDLDELLRRLQEHLLGDSE